MKKRIEGARNWVDARTGLNAALHHLLEEPLPSGVGWWFVTGGVLMAAVYAPSRVYVRSRTDARVTGGYPAPVTVERSTKGFPPWHGQDPHSRGMIMSIPAKQLKA